MKKNCAARLLHCAAIAAALPPEFLPNGQTFRRSRRTRSSPDFRAVQAREAQPPPSVVRAMTRMGVPVGHVSIYVRDAGTNEVVVDLGAEEPRSPASIIKVLTTFAALDMLGPGYTMENARADRRSACERRAARESGAGRGRRPVYDERAVVEFRAEPA